MARFLISVLVIIAGVFGAARDSHAERVQVRGWVIRNTFNTALHSAMHVFGKWYEYGVSQRGLSGSSGSYTNDEDPRLGEIDSAFGENGTCEFCSGETTKTETEFNKWLNETAKPYYRKDNYNVLWRNCHAFSRAAANFLDIACRRRDFIVWSC